MTHTARMLATPILLYITFVSEIHYHQNFLKGHVCVAGMNTSLNVQMPATATGQRYG